MSVEESYMDRQINETHKTGPEVARKLRRMAEHWQEDTSPDYDRETFKELQRDLDRDRPAYRKLFAGHENSRENEG